MSGGSNLGGGPYNGFSPQQTCLNYKDSEGTRIRRILRDSWNTSYATGEVNGHKRVITPFRAVNSRGDFLARVQYSCGGPNEVKQSYLYHHTKGFSGTRPNVCDDSGILPCASNSKFVVDSSDYITFKKQQAMNHTYNDLKNGGYTNSSYVPLMAVRRF